MSERPATRRLDIAEVRHHLAGRTGGAFWSSLEELAGTPEFNEMIHREFPERASEWINPVTRRHFLKLMGASLALAGVTSCTRQPIEKIVPYVQQPELLAEGKPLYFATAMPWNGSATGILVENHEGRPTKIEGNPDHPASFGATGVFEQAALLQLHDPERSRTVTHRGKPGTWDRFVSAMLQTLESQRPRRGSGMRLLTGAVVSPTLQMQIASLLERYPEARWHVYEPLSREAVYEGTRLAFGQPLEPRHDFSNADVILSLDADFLFTHPARLPIGRAFTQRRTIAEPKPVRMNRLYVVESTPTITGTMADHRLPLPATSVVDFARAVAAALEDRPTGGIPGVPAPWLAALANDLKRQSGNSLVIAGEQQPAEVHALAHWMNEVLGNSGRTVAYAPPAVEPASRQIDSVRTLVADMNAGRVQWLLILDSNPALTAPADLGFAEALSKVRTSAHWSLFADETSARCEWHVPAAHFLESWSDVRSIDGTASIIQPLVQPLYSGKTTHELLADLLQSPAKTACEIVRDFWRARQPAGDFEPWWRRALHDGVIRDSATPPTQVTLQFKPEFILSAPPSFDAENLEVTFRADPTLWDGRFANNVWLQEIPKPITKVTWDNPALISPALAERLGLADGDMVRLAFRGNTLDAAACIVPGQPEFSVTLQLGYGVGFSEDEHPLGFNTHSLRHSEAFWFGTGLRLTRLNRHYPLARTQVHHRLEGRNILRVGTEEQFRREPDFVRRLGEEPEHTLYNLTARRQTEHQWGMVINLNRCIGCNACTIACQSENNIPVVGKSEVLRSREMHWIRVDSYFKGGLDNPEIYHQPVTCMHCETAPCEYVCPVAATTHSHEGLNEMTYNRCIGTRYCSNNCPYKVRRFNFFEYTKPLKEPHVRLMLNPEVTIRTRGVMEKCTYCVQRISHARIDAKRENRRIRDGEIVPACAQVCPAEAIVFGDISDPESRVSKLRADSLNYGMLAELNTRPRTTYLAKLRNPNPELESHA